MGRIPHWDAWIEIELDCISYPFNQVASHIGMRGLKYAICIDDAKEHCRIPHWDAWIEILVTKRMQTLTAVASHIGMRGLKY